LSQPEYFSNFFLKVFSPDTEIFVATKSYRRFELTADVSAFAVRSLTFRSFDMRSTQSFTLCRSIGAYLDDVQTWYLAQS